MNKKLIFKFRWQFYDKNKNDFLISRFLQYSKSRVTINLEGLVGFEPTIRELQSHALPLGYRPI